MENVSSALKISCKTSVLQIVMILVSSAYWLTGVDFGSSYIGGILGFLLMYSAIISTPVINRYGDSGHPCLTPLESGKNLDICSLLTMQLSALL